MADELLLERVLIGPRLRLLTSWLAQSARDGALPTLRAAGDPSVRGGDYYSPRDPFGDTSAPVHVGASPHAHDRAAKRRLWQLSEQLTGVAYPLPTPATE